MFKKLRTSFKNTAKPPKEPKKNNTNASALSGADISRASDVSNTQDRAVRVEGGASVWTESAVEGQDETTSSASEAGRVEIGNASGKVTDEATAAPLAPESNVANLAKGVGKTLLALVEVVSDPFPPLKSAAAGINFVIELVKNTGGNKTDAEGLLQRIEAIGSSWSTPTEDTYALQCRSVLTKALDAKRDQLKAMIREKIIQRALTASDTKEVIQDYIRDIEQALDDYERSLVEDIHRLDVKQTKHDERDTLDKLPRAKDAGFDAAHGRSRCLEGTRAELLAGLKAWATHLDAAQIYWLNGHAGSGKSTIAQSFAEWLTSKNQLGASFFCSRYSPHRSDLKMILPTIAFQLARAKNAASPQFRAALLRILEENPDVASLSLHNQLQNLIVDPVKESKMKSTILIDALDECRDDEAISTILSLLSSTALHIPFIRFFITSRPEPHIRLGFRLPQLKPITEVMLLHEVASTSVYSDIRLFLQKKLGALAAHRSDVSIGDDWPKETDLDALATDAAGLFIFAATAVKFVESKDHDPSERLDELLGKSDSGSPVKVSPGLDGLYLGILQRAFPRSDEAFLIKLRSVLGFLVVARDILLPATIAEMLCLKPNNVKTSLRSLHSLLLVPEPEDTTTPIRFHHKSFPDFLADFTRCTDPRFHIDQDQHHSDTAARCFVVMESKLKKNICGLPRYAMNDVLEPIILDRCISEALRYSCRYWEGHLLADGDREKRLLSDADRNNAVPGKTCLLYRFLTTRQLQWFEVLSLLRNLRYAVDSLIHLQEWLAACGDKYKTLLDWADSGRRFILHAFDIVDISVAHIYHSALPFTSTQSLHKSYHAADLACEATVIIGGPKAQKGGPIRTVQMRNQVHVLGYSPDGTMIAAGGWKFSCLFRSDTGEQLAELDRGDCGVVNSLTFSYDNQTLATVSNGRITLWDVRTGASTITLQGNGGLISSVAFHPDSIYGDLLAWGTYDGRVCLWNVGSDGYSCQQEFAVQRTDVVLCWLRRRGHKIVFIGGRESGRTELWEVDPPRQVRVFQHPEEESSEVIWAVTSSSDGSFVASGSSSGHLVVYDVDTGTSIHHIQTANSNTVTSLQISPTAKPCMLAFAMLGSTAMRVFYPEGTSDHTVSLFKAHGENVTSVAFSPDGRFAASGAFDKTVNIWETGVADLHQDEDDGRSDSELIMCTHFSNNGQLLVSGSDDRAVRVWDTCSGTLESILRDHSDNISDAVILSDTRFVFFLDGRGLGHLWDRSQDKTIVQQKIAEENDLLWDNHLSSYTHGILGLFRCAGDISVTGKIDCWTIEQVDGPAPRMFLAAQGDAPPDEFVVRLSQQTQLKADDNVILVLECKSGKRYFATWRSSRAVADTTETLQFVEEAGEALPLIGVDNALASSEAPCYQSGDKKWVLDRQGRRILGIPPIYQGPGRWHGERLVLEGGRLLLVDFSRVRLDIPLDSPF